MERSVKLKKGRYYYEGAIDGKRRDFYLSDEETDRRIMIALPLKHEQKFVGGLTFDIDCNITENEDPEKEGFLFGEDKEVISICSNLNNISANIITAYFSKK